MLRSPRRGASIAVVFGLITSALLLAPVTPAGAGSSRATQCVVLLTNTTGSDVSLKSVDNGPGDVWQPKPHGSVPGGTRNYPITAVDEQGHGCRASVVYHLDTRSCDNPDACDFHLSIGLKKKGDSDHFTPEVACNIDKQRLACVKLFTRFERRDLQVGFELSTHG